MRRTVPNDGRVLAQVIELAAGVAGAGRPTVNPDADTPLADGGFWLDSLALLELVVGCEQTFGVSFDAADLMPDRLTTTGSLAALIESRLALERSSGS
jgi:acyl carrier protein